MSKKRFLIISVILIVVFSVWPGLWAQVANTADEICPLMPGEAVPDVALDLIDGTKVNFKEQVAKKPTIFVFYRGGW